MEHNRFENEYRILGKAQKKLKVKKDKKRYKKILKDVNKYEDDIYIPNKEKFK